MRSDFVFSMADKSVRMECLDLQGEQGYLQLGHRGREMWMETIAPCRIGS